MSKVANKWIVITTKTTGAKVFRTLRVGDLSRIIKVGKTAGITRPSSMHESWILESVLSNKHLDIKTIENIEIKKV